MNISDQIQKEVERVTPILKSIGFIPQEKQLHISGERKVFGFKKLVLVCEDLEGEKVVVKCSRFKEGKKEIKKEKRVRDHLEQVPFADDTIAFPEEIFYGKKKGYIFFVTEYIEQKKVFVDHSLEEQFFMTLGIFERQESFHANTFEHLWYIRRSIPLLKKKGYQKRIFGFRENILKNDVINNTEKKVIEKACNFFIDNSDIIATYCCYLTHEDLVPHNFRIHNNQIYLLDYSSLQYGNKYESWARFINYMTIHNPKLTSLLTNYVKNERGSHEYESLKVMRIFKAFQLLNFYSGLLETTENNLLELTKVRIHFWISVLNNTLEDQPLSQSEHDRYIQKRDSLRSSEEKERQKEFARI